MTKIQITNDGNKSIIIPFRNSQLKFENGILFHATSIKEDHKSTKEFLKIKGITFVESKTEKAYLLKIGYDEIIIEF